MTVDPSVLRAEAAAQLPALVAIREDLHRHPELGLHTPRTQAAVLAALEGLGLEVSTGTGLTSVTAVLCGSRPGPAVLLRGDMDGLPLAEDSGESFASEEPGAMHACGHDLHVAGLIGATRLLAAHQDELAGSVVFMFQPGEEGSAGAQRMIDEGVLDAAGERVVAAYALHVMSAILPGGLVASRAGTVTSASDSVTVTVHGRGGHGSMPHLAADPVPVAAEIILALQAAVTRRFDVFDPVVVTVGRLTAGQAENVIPATAELQATVRSFTEQAHGKIPDVFRQVCEHVALAHGLTATVDYRVGYPVTVNDAGETQRVAGVARSLFGPQAFFEAPQPIAGSEDFAFVLQQVPGAMFALGATPRGVDPGQAAYNHSAKARFDSAALAVGPAVLAGLALDRLAG